MTTLEQARSARVGAAHVLDCLWQVLIPKATLSASAPWSKGAAHACLQESAGLHKESAGLHPNPQIRGLAPRAVDRTSRPRSTSDSSLKKWKEARR